MSDVVDFYKLCFVLLAVRFSEVRGVSELNNKLVFLDTVDPEKEIADFIFSKGYLPKEKLLSKVSPQKSEPSDVTYLLSKLSDDELIQLLNNPKKREYDLNDLAQASKDVAQLSDGDSVPRSRFRTVTSKPVENQAFFRLDHKPVKTGLKKAPGYNVQQALNNILYSRPLDRDPDDDASKKELMFDILMSQLKSLCCSKPSVGVLNAAAMKPPTVPVLQPLLDDFKPLVDNMGGTSTQYMFLIINDEITSNGTDELISVDPESLDGNSSALLLGPINSPLTDPQLKLVMDRITSELSKPEYLPLLIQISEGSLSDSNIKIVKSLVTGAETRRYIKPHRCNHVSKLAKTFGGPKWIVCTGYLNLNGPSMYDRK